MDGWQIATEAYRVDSGEDVLRNWWILRHFFLYRFHSVVSDQPDLAARYIVIRAEIGTGADNDVGMNGDDDSLSDLHSEPAVLPNLSGIESTNGNWENGNHVEGQPFIANSTQPSIDTPFEFEDDQVTVENHINTIHTTGDVVGSGEPAFVTSIVQATKNDTLDISSNPTIGDSNLRMGIPPVFRSPNESDSQIMTGTILADDDDEVATTSTFATDDSTVERTIELDNIYTDMDCHRIGNQEPAIASPNSVGVDASIHTGDEVTGETTAVSDSQGIIGVVDKDPNEVYNYVLMFIICVLALMYDYHLTTAHLV